MSTNMHSNYHLSLKDVFTICSSYWRMFMYFFLTFFVIGLAFFILKIPYVSNAIMVFNDSQNSSVQAFSQQFYGLSKTVQETKKGSSLLNKHIEFLKTRQFFESLLSEIPVRGNSSQITLDERKGYELFKLEFMEGLSDQEIKIGLLQKLDQWVKISVESDFQIKVTVLSPHRLVSMFLANTVIDLASQELKKRELEEINRVEKFISEQKNITDENLRSIGQKIVENENKNENILPLAAKEKMSDYISELMVRSHEIKMKISENQILVRQLESNRVQSEESELYGVAGRIAILKSENDLLTGKSNELLRTINRVKKDLVHAPYQIEVSEDLKKKSEIEYLRFRELSSALEKLEAAKMSIDARFEVLEKARMESTYPKTSLSVIFMVVFLLSQAFGFVVIYIRFLIHPEKLALASGSLQQFEGSFENEFQLLGKTNKRPEQRADFLN